jgi:glycosyltransferase involved in cell wall biosynthesis
VATVVFATEYYPPFAPGGAEWSNARWAAALSRRGHRVVVVTPNYGTAPREEHDGVLIVRFPFPIRLRPGQGEAGWLVHRNLLFHLYLACWVWRVARRAAADVIHAQHKGAVVGAWLAGRALRRPVLATIRDVGLLCPLGFCTMFEPWSTFDCTARQYVRKCAPFFFRHYLAGVGRVRRARIWAAVLLGWLDLKVRQAALRRVDGVIGVSRGILSLHPASLIDPARARVVHTLPPDIAAPDEATAVATRRRLGIADGPLVLYAGRLSMGKGVPVLVDALDRLRASVPGAVVALAGKGEVAVAPRPGLHVLGSVAQPDLFALYRAADVVVVPSLWPEPLSRVLLEAMQLGRPVVATDAGGTAEAVVDGETGILVPRGDPEALADALARLLRHPGLRARMSAAAARRAADVFVEERVAAALLEAYRTAMAGAS